MYFVLKYIVTLFYKKLRIKIVVSLLRESGPRMESYVLGQPCSIGYRRLEKRLSDKGSGKCRLARWYNKGG